MDRSRYMVDDNSLTQYLKDISKSRGLSTQEECALAIRIRKNDKKALAQLVHANLRFVVSVARNYQNQGLPLCDLVNEGNLGLIRAARRFDEKKNFKFISYGVWWVRQAILQALAEQSRIVKVPLNKVGVIHRIGKTSSKLEQKYHRSPGVDEIARELNIDIEEVRDTLIIGNDHTSLDAPALGNEDCRLIDLLKDNTDEQSEEQAQDYFTRSEIEQTLNALPDREKNILRLYYGIGEETSHTLEEIGVRFNLTRERARQIKEKALRRLKHVSRSKTLKAAK